jgi:hypothetical protein
MNLRDRVNENVLNVFSCLISAISKLSVQFVYLVNGHMTCFKNGFIHSYIFLKFWEW